MSGRNGMKMQRREFLRVVAVGGGAAFIVACAPGVISPSAEPSQTSQAGGRPLSPAGGAPKRGGMLRARGTQLVHLDTPIRQAGAATGLVSSPLPTARAASYERSAEQAVLI